MNLALPIRQTNGNLAEKRDKGKSMPRIERGIVVNRKEIPKASLAGMKAIL